MDPNYLNVIERLRKEYQFIHKDYPRSGGVSPLLKKELQESLSRAKDLLHKLGELNEGPLTSIILEIGEHYVSFRQRQIKDWSEG